MNCKSACEYTIEIYLSTPIYKTWRLIRNSDGCVCYIVSVVLAADNIKNESCIPDSTETLLQSLWNNIMCYPSDIKQWYSIAIEWLPIDWYRMVYNLVQTTYPNASGSMACPLCLNNLNTINANLNTHAILRRYQCMNASR